MNMATVKSRTAWVFAALLILSGVSGWTQLVPPPEPAVKPIVSAPTLDTDQSKIDDRLEATASRATEALSRVDATESEKQTAQKILDAKVSIELVFGQQITQEQIDAFIAAGGDIDHIFKAVSYGWTGEVALKTVSALPKLMGSSLLGVAQASQTEPHIDIAAKTGRVRPILWDTGVDGDRVGSASITVAILDTGVDGTHADLAGRQVYWKDWSSDNLPTAQDARHHGSHVAGIAIGSGISSGTDPATISFMSIGSFPDTSGFFMLDPINVPLSVSNFDWTSDMRWDTGSTVTSASVGHLNFDILGGAILLGATGSASSPVSYSTTSQANPPAADRVNRYNLYATKAAGTGTVEYAVANTVTFASAGDGYPVFQGVAPDCNWAGLKIFPSDGSSGSSVDFGEALDDIVTQSQTYGIKVANMSLGIVGDPGLDVTVRNKVNTAAQNGIVMVVSAGNDGQLGAGAIGEVDDPGRAQYAITVAAAADDTQLTSYSSHGVPASGVDANGDNDMKPDIMAPGGSDYETNIMSIDSNTGDSKNTAGANFPDSVASNYYNIKGTSMAAPFMAGCSALVIDALQQSGYSWSYSLDDVKKVKMLLLMTATESNLPREATPSADPTLDRGAKDMSEGYGLVNADAAVDAAMASAYVLGSTVNGTFGADSIDARCWASPVLLQSGTSVNLKLTVPAGADYDIYVYSATPDTYGNPVIIQSATGSSGNESLVFTPSADENAFVVVKKVSGSGSWTLGEGFLEVSDWRRY